MQTVPKQTLLTIFLLPLVLFFSHTLPASQQAPTWTRSHSHPSLQEFKKQLLKPQERAKKVRRCSLKTCRTTLALLAAIALIFGGVLVGLKANTVGRQAEELLHESKEMVNEGKMVVNKTDIMLDEALSLLGKLHNLTDSLPHFPDRPGWWPDRPLECSPTTMLLITQVDQAVQQNCQKTNPSDHPMCPYAITLVRHLQAVCQNQTTKSYPLSTKTKITPNSLLKSQKQSGEKLAEAPRNILNLKKKIGAISSET